MACMACVRVPRTRWEESMTLAPLAVRYSRVGMAARMRVSSVISSALSSGTLRSARTKTTLSCGRRFRGRRISDQGLSERKSARRGGLVSRTQGLGNSPASPQAATQIGAAEARDGASARYRTLRSASVRSPTDFLAQVVTMRSGAAERTAGRRALICTPARHDWIRRGQFPWQHAASGAQAGAHQRRRTWRPSARQPGPRGGPPPPGGPRG